MDEILLQTMIDKLEKIDRCIQILQAGIDKGPGFRDELEDMNQRMRTMQMEIKSLPQQILRETVVEGRVEAIRSIDQLKAPVKEKIKHVHYLSKPLLACILLVMIILWLGSWLRNEMDAVSRMKENDIKYRMLNLAFDNNLRRGIHKADSLYLDDPDKLIKEVQAGESRRKELLNEIQRSLTGSEKK